MIRVALAVLAAITLSACERENPTLFNVRAQDRTPDEFGILPTRPLETPESFDALPPPTPGGVNRTDPQPQAEAIAALGGNIDRGVGADGALVAAVTRYGVEGNIRDRLAAEDLAFRRANDGRLLERLFSVNVYFDAYEPQSLDQHGELERLRRLGIRTVAAPPDPELLD
ncbi:DUF3035 domain-containing protein [Jannaschia seohaensis]|uniref:Beta-barrel assembly complex subunit BamF n=1 Tax=Jannaschia seohaensis TaxID=475081 RepID=A0A2Y9A1F3_9RHOB|nr:DUF3035 domain-containing protein [Jannaschia seohaensis]PWJ21992.1 Protein of unknown function (DUF3035) [Jannaschia seohaensis]SSA38270.1 Protein of unknown function [Jannaschia seohaensis]